MRAVDSCPATTRPEGTTKNQYSNSTSSVRRRTALVLAGLVAAGTVTVYGGSGNDYIHNGGDKQVVAYGEGGNDTLLGGSFKDQLYGGSGIDTAYVGAGDTTSSIETVHAN